MTIHTHWFRSSIACLLLACSLSASAGPVNVNTADAATLAKELNGVGMAKARAIVNYRDKHGPFSDLAQLAAVKGIGVKLLERNHENILLTD